MTEKKNVQDGWARYKIGVLEQKIDALISGGADPDPVYVDIVRQDNIDLFALGGGAITLDWDTSTVNEGDPTPAWFESCTSTEIALSFGVYALNFQLWFLPDNAGLDGSFDIDAGNMRTVIQPRWGTWNPPGIIVDSYWQQTFVHNVGDVSPWAVIGRINYTPACRYDGSSFVSGDSVSIHEGQHTLAIIKLA